MNCERCGKPTHLVRVCEYCKKSLCRACIKSAKRIEKVSRLIICKGCWGSIKKRRRFKSA